MTGARQRSNVTRTVHLLLAMAVLFQLASSQTMERPRPGEPDSWTFALHQYVGLMTFAIAGAFWAWALIRNGETPLALLVPWFSASQRGAVFADAAAQLRQLVRLQPPGDREGAFASAIQGLGLLTIAVMAMTGTLYYICPRAALGRIALPVHQLIANLAWAYLIGHAGMAVIHHCLGSDIFSHMFWLRGRQPPRSSGRA